MDKYWQKQVKLRLIMTSRLKKELRKNFFETGFETGLENGIGTGFETSFEPGFETGRVVLGVERSKRKYGSKRSQGNKMEDVSHRKTMPLAAGK